MEWVRSGPSTKACNVLTIWGTISFAPLQELAQWNRTLYHILEIMLVVIFLLYTREVTRSILGVKTRHNESGSSQFSSVSPRSYLQPDRICFFVSFSVSCFVMSSISLSFRFSQVIIIAFTSLKMEVICSSETMLTIHKVTRCHSPEGHS